MTTDSPDWSPTEVRMFIKPLDSGAGTVVVETDAGRGYLKVMGNHGGEHVLACELVGTKLAQWFGLSTFDFALIEVTKCDEIPLYRGTLAEAGPAFVTREERGQSWGGSERQLKKVVNRVDISRLVVFDTWIRNRDRRSPDGARVNLDNVFLSEESPEPGMFVLRAMDHTHCFTTDGQLSRRLAQIDAVKDEGVYGLFPEFRRFLDRNVVRQAVAQLRQITRQELQMIVDEIPAVWDVDQAARTALIDFLLQRAAFVAETIEVRLWPQSELRFPEAAEDGR